MNRDVDFMRLNLEPLANTIQANARAWVKELGKMLNDSARENLMALKTELEVKHEDFICYCYNHDSFIDYTICSVMMMIMVMIMMVRTIKEGYDSCRRSASSRLSTCICLILLSTYLK